jgi:hypothetical protein
MAALAALTRPDSSSKTGGATGGDDDAPEEAFAAADDLNNEEDINGPAEADVSTILFGRHPTFEQSVVSWGHTNGARL